MSAIARPYGAKRWAGLERLICLNQVATVAVFISILAVAVLPRFDADLWWHLYVGSHILSHGVPGSDFLSFTVRGKPWIDHEWLSEIGMFGVYKLGGLKLLLLLFGLVITAAFAFVYLVMKLRGVNQILALTITVLAAASTVGGWGPRIQMLSLLFTAGFCFALERYRATAGMEWLIGLVVGSWIWSNLHGGFVIGLLLMAVYLVGGAIDRVQGGMTWKQATRSQKPFLLALVGATLVTAINPNTYRQLEYPLKFLTPNSFTNTIQESLSPNFHLYQLLPFELMLIGLIVCAFIVRRRVSWVDVLLCACFTHLALQQTRNVALWCVVVAPIFAVFFQEAGMPLFQRWRSANRPVSSRATIPTSAVLLLLMLVAGSLSILRANSTSTVLAAERSSFPAGGMAYIETHHLGGRVFNSYGLGGYAIWNTNAAFPVFIDSRADTVYTGQVLQDYLTIYNAQPGWARLLHQYRIQWLFVEPSAPIAVVLAQRPGWRMMFHGDLSTIIDYKGGGKWTKELSWIVQRTEIWQRTGI